MSKQNNRFSWVVEDDVSDLVVRFRCETQNHREAVVFHPGHLPIAMSRDEWLELVASVDEFFSANGEPLDYSILDGSE